MASEKVMTESVFNDHIDKLFETIEQALDDSGSDVDSDINAGVLTIYCQDSSQIIFSRQVAQRQLWMAAKSGGFHFVLEELPEDGLPGDNKPRGWTSTRDDAPLQEKFLQVFMAQTGESININFSC